MTVGFDRFGDGMGWDEENGNFTMDAVCLRSFMLSSACLLVYM